MPITLGDCTWKTTLSGQPEVQSLPCSQLGLDVLQEGADWRWGPGLGSRRACPAPALALPCEVALGAPLMPFVSASLLSLCLGGLQCVKHRAELPKTWISAAIKLLLCFTTFKMLCVAWENGLVQAPFFLCSLVCFTLPSRTAWSQLLP